VVDQPVNDPVHHPRPRDDGGWAPLEAYGVLGDGRSAALVADDGSVDWWPVPTIDAPPICAAILDPGRGGSFTVAPTDTAATCTRSYLAGTNVLVTEWTTAAGTARVTDALTTGRAGRLPWTELSRRIEGLSGTVELRWTFLPGDRFGRASPWATMRDGTPVMSIGDQTVGLLVSADDGVLSVSEEVSHHRVSGRITVDADRQALVTAVASDREPLYVSTPEALNARLDRTVRDWRAWSSHLRLPERWAGDVERSALALKTLLFEPGGAIAAAATTSLPEAVGGPKNWDYRYSWVRDSSFTVDAFINLGLHEEVQAAVSWLLGALHRSAPHMEIFYTLDGDPPPPASSIAELEVPGWRHSRPVRAGNAASGQVQLGVYGDLFDTIWRYCTHGHILDEATAGLLIRLADQCCDRWRIRDAGIWELPDAEHYTISKIGCWVALDRASRLARDGKLPGGKAERWAAEAADIHNWVDAHCWSDAVGAYTLYAGTDHLDAACLLAGRTGFDRGERLAGTVDAVARSLGEGPNVWRYTGMQEEEGAFVACSFWWIEALVHVGRLDDAVAAMDRAVASLPNELGILSEQTHRSGAALGNLPQGLSHLSLVNAAFAIDKATGIDPNAARSGASGGRP
jgi:GH15 family glucan-1,4-alpha-glucosidase